MSGNVNAVRAIVCFKLPAREASNISDFWEIISSLIEVNFCFLDVLIKHKFT